MDTNVTVAIVTGSCTAVVGIAAIVVNTFWVRYSLEKLGERITGLDHRLERLEDRMNAQFDTISGKLGSLDLEVGKLMDRNT